jgi:hypothetical protein
LICTFAPQNGSAPSIPELKEYFSAFPLFRVSDRADDGVQFWYQNEATGVYCDFSYSPLDANELEGCGSSGLSFNLNYSRHSFFSYEAMPLVEAFGKVQTMSSCQLEGITSTAATLASPAITFPTSVQRRNPRHLSVAWVSFKPLPFEIFGRS